MDDFKYIVIEKVREMPLLWDPEHVDYKNKDQRQQAWEKLEGDMKPHNKGVTVKETWESLNRAFNSALNRRKKKTSGSARVKGKPWKFEISMSFLKTVKQKRNTTSNLDEIDESDTEENSSAKQAKDKSGICDVDDDDDDGGDDHDDDHSLASSTPLKPVSQKPSSIRTGSKQKATDDAQADDDGSLGSSSTLKPVHQKRSSKCTGIKRKAANDAHDDARTGLYRVMTQRMEDKQKSPRLKFFESIMPQVDELTDDCFLDFQMEVLRSLKRFRHYPDPKRFNDNRPVTPTSWITSTPSQPCTPAPATASAPSTPYPVQGGFLPPTPQPQQCYGFPN